MKDTKLFRPTFRDGRPDVLPDLEREFGLGMTTPRDMAKLMVLIASGRAVSKEASAAMLATLRRQQDRAMIPRLIQNEDGVEIGNKTGTDEEKHALADGVKRHVRADAAIVSGPNYTYAIAIYARQVEDRRWGIDNDALTTGASISRTIFEDFSQTALEQRARHAFVVQQPALAIEAAAVTGERAVAADDAVARQDDGNGLAPLAAPTARTAAGASTFRASSAYDEVVPAATDRNASHTRCWKSVPWSSTSTSSRLVMSPAK